MKAFLESNSRHTCFARLLSELLFFYPNFIFNIFSLFDINVSVPTHTMSLLQRLVVISAIQAVSNVSV